MAQINLDNRNAVRASYLVDWEVPYYRTTPTGSTSNETLTFSDDDLTTIVNGLTYVPLGKLLQITPSSSTIGATTNTISLTLSGVPDSEIGAVLYSNIKGTLIRINRYFWDAQSTTTSLGPAQGRFFGYVESYSITDDYDYYNRSQTVSVTLNLNSWVDYIAGKMNARQTNPRSMDIQYPGDTSFDRIPKLKDTEFNFGAGRSQSSGTTRQTWSNTTGGMIV